MTAESLPEHYWGFPRARISMFGTLFNVAPRAPPPKPGLREPGLDKIGFYLIII